jgi:TolB-like protein/DNA-binding winged helix-turn-helix (wHTH) protein/Tfp pilus assembly protein PilF
MDRVVWGGAPSIAALHLDVGNECLWWGAQRIALTPKAYAILRYLVEHRDQLVTKESLLGAAWPDACVEEGQVKQFVAELRRILHDDPKAPRFIETVHGRGYRLIGDIGLRAVALNVVPNGERSGFPRAAPQTEARAPAPATVRAGRTVPRIGSRPTLAVLPFRNLSGDPDDDAFAEGVAEDVVEGFARNRSLSVLGRPAALRGAAGNVDPRRLAAELGVGYVLDGALRRHGAALRLSVHLVDAEQVRTIWSERYEGTLEERLAFQDRVGSGIVATIEPHVLDAEVARLAAKPADRFDAHDFVLRASSLLYTFDERDLARAGRDLDRAIELDPSCARAYAYKAWWCILSICEERSQDPARDTVLARDVARRAMALDPRDAFVVAVAAHVEALLHGQPEVAADMFERSLQLNGNSAFAWGLSAATCCYLGESDEALARLRTAERLSPLDPFNFYSWSAAGLAECLGGRYDDAVAWLRKALGQNPCFVASHRTLTTALWQAGRRSEAKAAARNLLALDPKFRISSFAARYPLRRPDDLKRYVGGLRAAGLPD